jgi:hypothetical protein
MYGYLKYLYSFVKLKDKQKNLHESLKVCFLREVTEKCRNARGYHLVVLWLTVVGGRRGEGFLIA